MRARHLLALAALLWTQSCLAQNSLVGIRIQPENIFLTSGNHKALSATFNGSPARAIWMSDTPVVATVDSTGMVTAAPGVTAPTPVTITAVSGIFRNSTTVTVVPPPIIGFFTTFSANVTLGQPVSLQGQFANGTGVINGSNGTNINVQNGIIAQAVAALGLTTYTLTVTNPAGDTITAAPVTITAIPPPVIFSFSPSSQLVTQGNNVALSGSFSGGSATVINNATGVIASLSTSPFTVIDTPAAGASTTYTLIVSNNANPPANATATTTVQVVPPPVITFFSSTPTHVASGGTVTFFASFSNAGGAATILPGNISITSGASTAPVQVNATTGFALIVTNQAGTSAVATTVVSVP